MPDYHMDFEFSRTFQDIRENILVMPVSVPWNLCEGLRTLDIPWEHLRREAVDRGYAITVSKSGVYEIRLAYAKEGLSRRLQDLTRHCSHAFPIRSSTSDTGRLLTDLLDFAESCGGLQTGERTFECPVHPVRQGAFFRFLHRHRMKRPE
jgi:hypothetical protein|tara:strand:+ start:70 stop:519 length:450 start_codon:yes stop_codon:yes gene_type:complete